MTRKQIEMMLRVIFGILILSIIAIMIIPQTQKKDKVSPSIATKTQKEVVISHIVNLTSKGFVPQKITIKKGEVIVWSNKSSKKASVNSADYPTHKLFPVLNLGLFNDGENVQARIFRTGELRYVNHLIPSQTGTITVTD